MNPKRFFYVMIGVVVLLSGLAVGSIVVGNGLLTKKSDKLAELKLENQVLEEQKADLVRAKASIEEYKELDQIAKQIVPQDKNQAKTARELINLARLAGIQVASLTFPASSLGGAAVPSSGSSSPSSSSSSAAKQPPSVTQVIPVPGIKGLYQLDITLQTASDSVDYPRLQAFLKLLEGSRRTARVSSLTITPSTANRSVLTVGMTVSVYIKP